MGYKDPTNGKYGDKQEWNKIGGIVLNERYF